MIPKYEDVVLFMDSNDSCNSVDAHDFNLIHLAIIFIYFVIIKLKM
jgi:hypothetical protein